jgi:hypothetical protein
MLAAPHADEALRNQLADLVSNLEHTNVSDLTALVARTSMEPSIA